MAKRYRPVLRDQPFLLPPDMREWLPAAHPVWVVIAAVDDHLDTSVFHAARRTGHEGTAGYDPDMLLALLFWAYVNGIASSRQIEAACWSDVAFRVICAQDVPDHVTICRFRSDFGDSVQDLFGEVLVLCARLGMGKLGTIALDGMKITASASKSANRTEEHLRKLAAGAVAAHAAADAAEDRQHGPGVRGDEVPAEVADPATRAGRIAAALAGLEAERRAAEQAAEARGQAYLQAAAGGHRSGNVPAAVAVTAAQARLERERAAQIARIQAWQQRQAEGAAAGRRRGGNRPPAGADACARVRNAAAGLEKARARAARAERKAAASTGQGPVRNITDPASRLMPVRGGGFIQGYNAQNVTSEDGLIIATRLTASQADAPWYEPMITAAQDAAARITAASAATAAAAGKTCTCHDPAPGDGPAPPCARHPAGIGLVLADAGYLSAGNLTAAGPDRLIATGKRRTLEKDARASSHPGTASDPDEDPIAAMSARLATPEGIAAYRRRSHIAETPHGQIKHNMRFRQLSVRGTTKTQAEWTFVTAVHNLLKAITTGHATTAALAALPR